jgi:putative FmdB family regulatory protein
VPIHEYSCPGCGRFEILQRFSDQPLAVCPTCGKEVTRLISAPAIQFKGSGWYVTDYARKPAPASSPAKAEGAKGSSERSPDKSTSTESSATGSSPTK